MEKLTKNKARLLKLFFTNPEKSFYMQEIGRIIERKPGVFQRTLNNLVSEGILENEHRANARYFWINKKYPLYKELKSIIFKTVGVEGSIKKGLLELKNIHFAWIYGSFAKSKENTFSDIDLIIVGEPEENKLINEIEKLEKQLQREINYNLYSRKKFKADLEGKNAFLLDVLKNRKILLIGSADELRKIC